MEITRDLKQIEYGKETCFTNNIENPRYRFSQIEMKSGFDTGFLKKSNFITNIIINGSIEVSFFDLQERLKKISYKAGNGWVVLPNGIHRIVALEDTKYFQIMDFPEGEIIKINSISNVQNELPGKDHVVPVSEYYVNKPWGEEHWLAHPDYWHELGFGVGPYAVKRIIMKKKGKQSSLQLHEKKSETNVIIKGAADVLFRVPEGEHDEFIDTLKGGRFFLKRYKFLADKDFVGWSVPIRVVHRVINNSDYYEAIEASTTELDDVIRLLDDTNRGDGAIPEEHSFYKVCILAAGKGTRVSYATDFNKALLPVGKKSALTRIIEKFPKTIEIVIPIGYKGELIKEFVEIAYPDRKVTFVEVDNYDGPGSGPGLSLLYCKPYLQCPFIWTSVDTIVEDDVPPPTKNWVGVSKVSDSGRFLMADAVDGVVKTFFDKVPTDVLLEQCYNKKDILSNAFVGMAGVNDYKIFWESLEKDTTIIRDERQVSNGLNGILKANKKVYTRPFYGWFDTGTTESYLATSRHFDADQGLIKPGEFIYFEDGLVVKYYANENIVNDRIKRANLLKGVVPKILNNTPHFYAYKFVDGKMLSEVIDIEKFEFFLDFCKENLWKRLYLSEEEMKEFKRKCRTFYYDKTLQRINDFYKMTETQDEENIINGVYIPKLSELLLKVDFEKLEDGIPVLFHGDLQPENIIVVENPNNVKDFSLLDWRQDFAGATEYGDLYYDLAKLKHALIISGEVIRANNFNIEKKGKKIRFSYHIKSNLLNFLEELEKFIKKEGYDMEKVNILTALIYLNIAPLYHYPYNLFLYYLGKYTLYKALKK
jgi:dTDP-glucose pyrophosphorylase